MKKLIIAMSLLLTVNNLNAQTDSVTILKVVDDMDDASYLIPSNRLVLSNSEQTQGFIVDVFIKNDFQFNTLYVKMIGIGGCNEKDEIIIQLADGEKIKAVSWKSFNCDGETYFNLTKDNLEKIKQSPISKIRMTNGRSFESFTGTPDSEQSRWFIQLFYAMDNKFFTLIEE